MARQEQQMVGIGAEAPRTEAGGSRSTAVGLLLRWLAPAGHQGSAADISEHLMRDIAFTRADIDLLARGRIGLI